MEKYKYIDKKKDRFAFVIPVHNHEERVADVIKNALKLNFPVIVVDDGSTDSSYKAVKDINGIILLQHKRNCGKGKAIMTGFLEAVKIADWAITIDADGQHDPHDVVNLIQAIDNNQCAHRPIVIGKRENMIGPDVPWTSSFGRKFSNFWVWLSGGPCVSDSQSGYRIYPIPESMNLKIKSERFQFEVEVLVKAKWKGIPFLEAPVSVNYKPGSERISHFRPFIDFCRNSAAFTRLITLRIIIPSFIRKKS